MATEADLAVVISGRNESSAAFTQLQAQLRDLQTASGQLARGLGQSGAAAESAGRSASHAANLFGEMKSNILMGLGIGSGIQAFETLKGAVEGMIEIATEAERTQAQLNAVLRSTHDAAGISASAADELALSLSQVTPFSKEATLGVENLLLTFTNIKGDSFNEATKAVLNMSTALGQDTKNSAIQLGKALQDPVLGLTALKRVGVEFTAEQKDQIAAMVKMGDTAGAQKLILAELNKEFGGSAEAAGTTLAGQISILQNRFEVFEEHIGSKTIPVLSTLLNSLNQIIDATGKHDLSLADLGNIPVPGLGIPGVGGVSVTDAAKAIIAPPKFFVDEAIINATMYVEEWRHVLRDAHLLAPKNYVSDADREAYGKNLLGEDMLKRDAPGLLQGQSVAAETILWSDVEVKERKKIIAESEKLGASLKEEDDSFLRHARSAQINAPIVEAAFKQEIAAAKDLGGELAKLGDAMKQTNEEGAKALSAGLGGTDFKKIAAGLGKGIADQGQFEVEQAKKAAEKAKTDAAKAKTEADRQFAEHQTAQGLERANAGLQEQMTGYDQTQEQIAQQKILATLQDKRSDDQAKNLAASLRGDDLRIAQQQNHLKFLSDKAANERDLFTQQQARAEAEIELAKANHDGNAEEIKAAKEKIALIDQYLGKIQAVGNALKEETAKDKTKAGAQEMLAAGSRRNNPLTGRAEVLTLWGGWQAEGANIYQRPASGFLGGSDSSGQMYTASIPGGPSLAPHDGNKPSVHVQQATVTVAVSGGDPKAVVAAIMGAFQSAAVTATAGA